MKKNLILLGLMLSISAVAQVGINTDTPTNTLHIVGLNNEEPLRVETLKNATSSSDKIVMITDTGVLKKLDASTNKLAEQLVDSHDFTPTNTILSLRQNEDYKEILLKSFSFTLTRKAVVTSNYNISYSVSRTRNQFIDDGIARSIQTFLKYNDTSSDDYFAYTTNEYTSTEENFAVTGFFSLSSSHTRTLEPGTYTISLYGATGQVDREGLRTFVEFGKDIEDFQVTAFYLE